MNASTAPPNGSVPCGSNSTQSPGYTQNSNEPLAVFTVLVLFGMVCVVVALTLRCCPSPVESEGREETESSAANRRERERKRSEYVHRVLKTRSWHRGKLDFSSEHNNCRPPHSSGASALEAALTIPSGDGRDGRREGRSQATAPPLPRCPEEPPDLEAEQPPAQSPPDADGEAVESEAIMCPPPVPVSPGCSEDGKEQEEDDERPECAICLCPFEESDRVCEANNADCRHVFHQECLEPWLLRHEHCPVCREAYLRRPGRGAKAGKRRP